MFGIRAFAETVDKVQQVTTMTNAERYQEMLVTTVIGVSTVFAILIFLWAFMVVMKFVFNRPAKKKSEVEEAVVSVKNVDDGELIAVLSAAVAAMMGTSGTKFRIKSFRRTK